MKLFFSQHDIVWYFKAHWVKYSIAWIEWIGVGAFSAGAGAMYGHFSNRKQFTKWTDYITDPGMGFNTAIVIASIGFGMFLSALIFKHYEAKFKKICR